MLAFDTILAAREAAAPYVRRSALLKNATLSKELDCDVRLKLELFQRTGSFKVRGSFAQLLERLSDAKAHGVVAVSGGNFAQGIAYAAQTLGVRCKVLMASNTPLNYVEATQGYGAEVEFQLTRIRNVTALGNAPQSLRFVIILVKLAVLLAATGGAQIRPG